jgi:hypothetical protein
MQSIIHHDRGNCERKIDFSLKRMGAFSHRLISLLIITFTVAPEFGKVEEGN